MRLKHLQLRHFRNYESLDLTFSDGLTILTGDNAQGKTNLLEAIFLLAMAKSHRTNVDSELIQWGQDQALIQGDIATRLYDFPLELILKKKGKIAKVNHLEQARLSQFIGKLNVVLFAPEDLQLIKGSPSGRRKFLDAELAQAHPVYLQQIVNYQRVLKQRNRYLKEQGRQSSFDDVYFDVLTGQLIDHAVEIIRYRQHFIEQLNDIASTIHTDLSNQRDRLSMTYESGHSQLDYHQLDTLTTQLNRLFEQSRSRERDQGVTLYGPHRDDVSFYLNDKLAQHYGSQGQQRTIVLSIKLAELELLNQLIGEYPVLLLDDVLSELDDQRQHLLMQRIENKVQTFLTTATIEGLQLEQLSNATIYQIEQGQIINQ